MADSCGDRVAKHIQGLAAKMSAPVTVVADTSELETDLDRIERGELTLPTVSAIELLIDNHHIETMPIYLGDEYGR